MVTHTAFHPAARRDCLHWGSTGTKNAELVPLRIGQDHPWHLALPNVDTRSSQSNQSLHLGALVVGTQVDMETVLPLLGVVGGQEQDPWQPIWLRLDLKHHRVIVDDHPAKRFTPPAAQRDRMAAGDNNLLPLKTHGRTILN